MKTQTLQQELDAAKKVADREQKKVKELEAIATMSYK